MKRRTISVRGETYEQLRDYCMHAGISMSDFVEQRVADFLAALPDRARSAISPGLRDAIVASAKVLRPAVKTSKTSKPLAADPRTWPGPTPADAPKRYRAIRF